MNFHRLDKPWTTADRVMVVLIVVIPVLVVIISGV